MAFAASALGAAAGALRRPTKPTRRTLRQTKKAAHKEVRQSQKAVDRTGSGAAELRRSNARQSFRTARRDLQERQGAQSVRDRAPDGMVSAGGYGTPGVVDRIRRLREAEMSHFRGLPFGSGTPAVPRVLNPIPYDSPVRPAPGVLEPSMALAPGAEDYGSALTYGRTPLGYMNPDVPRPGPVGDPYALPGGGVAQAMAQPFRPVPMQAQSMFPYGALRY